MVPQGRALGHGARSGPGLGWSGPGLECPCSEKAPVSVHHVSLVFLSPWEGSRGHFEIGGAVERILGMLSSARRQSP
jgi:hypothetical protein